MKQVIGRAIRKVGLLLASAMFAAAACAFLLLALYTFAAGILAPMLAALVTAGGALVLGGLLMLGGFCCRSVHRGSRRQHSPDPEELGGMVMHLLRRNAKKATVAALVAGVALGVSPELRRSLIQLLGELGKH